MAAPPAWRETRADHTACTRMAWRGEPSADSALSVNGWFAGPVEHRTSSSVRLQRSRTRPSAGGPARRGELWFAAHSRAAPEEMTTPREDLQDAVHRTERPAPALDALLSPAPIGRTAVWCLRSRQARLPVTGLAGRCGRRAPRDGRNGRSTAAGPPVTAAITGPPA
jgi:hypothetical protein